jgi:SAM-dependent methyltransferase
LLEYGTVTIDKFFKNDDLSNKKFLDFGCGEGHVAYVAATLHDAALSIGYDPKSSACKSYEKIKPNFFLTDNLDEVVLNSTYDFILLNDVLDHSSDPLAVLEQVKKIKGPNCKIIMRCHPWTSRHGTHVYKQVNKAFLHLVFTPDEIFAMGLKEQFAQQVLDPLSFYRDLIKQTELKIVKEDITTCPVEIFFTQNEEVMRRIKDKWKTSTDPELRNGTKFPRDVLEIEFVDYWLE